MTGRDVAYTDDDPVKLLFKMNRDLIGRCIQYELMRLHQMVEL